MSARSLDGLDNRLLTAFYGDGMKWQFLWSQVLKKIFFQVFGFVKRIELGDLTSSFKSGGFREC